MMLKRPRNPISTRMLHQLIVNNSIGSKASFANPGATMPTPDLSRSESRAKIALVVGGGGDPLSEYDAARAMCELAHKETVSFVCNDLIAIFPHHIDHAGTLHPDKMHTWVRLRNVNGHPMPIGRIWAHRSYKDFTDHTKDWQGSSGLLMTKVAREQGHTHVILCGVPMTPEANHFIRHQPWNAAPGFIRGWQREQHHLRPYIRSMSGWTRKTFGAPSFGWLLDDFDDGHPLHTQHVPSRA